MHGALFPCLEVVAFFFGIKDINAINLNSFSRLDEYIWKYYLLTRWRTMHYAGCLSLPECKIGEHSFLFTIMPGAYMLTCALLK